MTAKNFLLIALLIIQSYTAFCQQPPPEFYNGIDLLKTDQQLAKKDFLIATQKDSAFNGSYHFLGVIYLNEHKPDSAIWYFKKSIALNKDNANHTREYTCTRLINTYILQLDFANAFTVGYEFYKIYPDNLAITWALKDACLWAFYIKYNHLNPEYILPDLKPEYVVKAISEEYLILRRIKVNDEYLIMQSQSLASKKGADYDVLKCVLSISKKEVEVNFKINWDMNKYFGGETAPTQPVIDDAKNPVYERVGAMLVADNKTVLKEAIEKALK
jgi:hypothetical protein